MPFQSQYIVDEDVMKKWRFLLNPQQKKLPGLQDSINKTPQYFHISFTPDYDQYACHAGKRRLNICVSGLLMNIYESLLTFLRKLEGY